MLVSTEHVSNSVLDARWLLADKASCLGHEMLLTVLCE